MSQTDTDAEYELRYTPGGFSNSGAKLQLWCGDCGWRRETTSQSTATRWAKAHVLGTGHDVMTERTQTKLSRMYKRRVYR